ncbi:MAG: hypothetical protein HY819_00585 [Acidobacteria bacterium]|nr:hypothetical protein [Acidobacteriota bacterium]
MSYHTLQHLTVRLLFDEKFVKFVYEDPDSALLGLDLSKEEKAQLLAIDSRAWSYDSLRRLRTMRSLVEEFKASTTLVLAETRQLAFLDKFFSSPQFHDSIQKRGSMGLAFAEYLSEKFRQKELKTPQLADVLRLESLMARCRREFQKIRVTPLPKTLKDDLRIKFVPGADVGAFQANTVLTIQKIEKYLFEVNLMPAMVLCDDAPRLMDLPAVETKKKSYLMCVPAANGVSLIDIEKSDYLVLIEARSSLTIHQAIERAMASGITKSIAQEIIARALEEQTLHLV